MNGFGQIVAAVRLARLRYLSIMVTPFICGFVASGNDDYVYLALGTVAVIVYQFVTSVGNCVSDRTEDQVDYEMRTSLFEEATYEGLRKLVIACCVIYLAIVATMAFALDIQLDTIGFWVLYLAGTLVYSFARVKTKTFGPPILLGSLSAALAWVGYWGFHDAFSWTEGVHLEQFLHLDIGGVLTGPAALIGPAVLAMWIFGGSLCGSKDVPNLAGDAAIGYESIYLKIVRGPYAMFRVAAVMSLPYLATLVFVVAGYSQPSPWVLVAYPLAWAFAAILTRASQQAEFELVRELGYIYWQLFMSLILFSLDPSGVMATILLASFAWWFVMSRGMHCDPTLIKTENFSMVGTILRPTGTVTSE
jgi:hypothetical protein